MTPAARAWLEAYRPRAVSDEDWETLGPVVVDWVKGVDPEDLGRVTSLTRELTNYLRWARNEGLALDIEVLCTQEHINWYVSTLVGQPNSVSTVRSYLVKTSKVLNPTVWVQTVKISRATAKAPYSTEELAMIVATIEAVPTYRRAKLRLVVALCLGCGFDGRDIAWLPADALSVDDNGVHVAVSGERTRTVTCLAGIEDMLLRFWNDWAKLRQPGEDGANDEDDGETRLFGKSASAKARSETVSRITKYARLADGTLIRVGRLRAMWILHMLDSVIPITILCEQAHIKPGSSFSDFVELLDPPDPAQAAIFVRHAHPIHGDKITGALELWETAPTTTATAAAATAATATAAAAAPAAAATAIAAATTAATEEEQREEPEEVNEEEQEDNEEKRDPDGDAV